MTTILLICHDIPSMTVGATIPLYHLIKQLGKRYDIHLISFNSEKYDIEPIKTYLKKINTINIPEYLDIKSQLLYTTKNMLSYDNIHTRSFLNYYYHPHMNKLIQNSLKEIDIVITDMPMAFYAKNIPLPKIVYAFDAVSDYNYKMYNKAESFVSKTYWFLNYIKIHRYEQVYNNFDSCILVNKKDKKLLEKDIHTRLDVIPNGVDTEYFKNDDNNDPAKLVFLGDMSTPPNNDAVKYFIEEIYPKVLEKRNIPFWIVGRNPSKYIEQLGNEDNITVTGSVPDVRQYLGKKTIFITPMISGTGIKNKILEAMSMKLPVVSTSIGISGIDAQDGEEFLLADDSKIFAEKIIKLLDEPEFSDFIGDNARKFVKNNYSWEHSIHKMEDIIKCIST